METQSRRQILGKAGASLTATAVAATLSPAVNAASQTQRSSAEPFGYCLNTSTISGANLGIVAELELAAKVGYQAVEPWLREIDAYTKKSGTLKDLARRISDLGLSIEDAIAFSPWVIDDEAKRAAGLEQMKRDMDTVAQLGGKRIAAPPVGATEQADLDLRKAASRYAALVDLGRTMGVQPLVELWGHSKCLNRLADVTFVAIESGRPDASMLLDIFHLYKGGTDFASLKQINGASLHVIHMNDFPATPERARVTDAQRVYPGDGVAPFKQILTDVRDGGFRGFLSLELFNRDYWKQNPEKVAKAGIEKMRETVAKSLA